VIGAFIGVAKGTFVRRLRKKQADLWYPSEDKPRTESEIGTGPLVLIARPSIESERKAAAAVFLGWLLRFSEDKTRVSTYQRPSSFL
jgi:hypothetical protein